MNAAELLERARYYRRLADSADEQTRAAYFGGGPLRDRPKKARSERGGNAPKGGI